MFIQLTISRQYYEFTISHSYILEQRSSAAPREWSISVSFWRKTASLSVCWGYVAPSVWLALVSVINKLFVSTVHTVHHTFNPSTTITQILTLLYMLTSWVCDTTYKYIHIHNLQSFLLFSYLTCKQVSWPRTLMSGTLTMIKFTNIPPSKLQWVNQNIKVFNFSHSSFCCYPYRLTAEGCGLEGHEGHGKVPCHSAGQ
jgi:hypothetical protein